MTDTESSPAKEVEAVEEPKKRGRGRQVGDRRGLKMLEMLVLSSASALP